VGDVILCPSRMPPRRSESFRTSLSNFMSVVWLRLVIPTVFGKDAHVEQSG
jgi:hypothetical protein